ncbi:ACR3 family arsenite efflux transporter [Arthrospira platensis]|uniref:Arsenical-resistance protein ACR3 family protein n=1 Tax=Limnospira platensis NIES-46 TaxID=1236695 RepID=A0A5M3T9C5_LIMPL|nr:ACR3 family arsenite efflux transporter [Arthrospira platensis]AMW29834.1 arsenic transporter [Arthrospira platensis YZ]KDR54205.1 arsenic transporter [Arthrospira platensis str. Paraca]MBD2672105.1 ACR3 family arsenite efflux transporter [Arthrospira platensis FACHB-439]MBD2713187.1 ACR3 family arsenite efflux transporter [Arthrospira platensis FACHB-835]MDT9184576.1 ACR3 family arsenite efflux transporter [Limnospira sp. PMC 289.06]MDT9296827.1 ACR3 family arsenite efflux transporter [Ar
MSNDSPQINKSAVQAGGKLNVFEKYLTLWVILCIIAGIVLGRLFPGVAVTLDSMSIYQVSIPIAICLFFMMYPIMVKIDFTQAVNAAKAPKPVLLTMVVNWLIKPFTMVAFSLFFLGWLFRPIITGTEILRGAEIPIADSYIAGTILLGIAPCTAMVLMWGYLSYSNQGLTLVMVAVNSLMMLFLYAPLGRWLLSANNLTVPWQTILLSVLIYVGLPLAAGMYTRYLIFQYKGKAWFEREFLKYLSPVATAALLITLILLFAFKGDLIVENPLHILLIAVPLFLQTNFIFLITYVAALKMKLSYEDAAPASLIGASNHFEVAIATAVTLFGLNSGAALATVVGVLIEVPVMLMLVKFCQKTAFWFPREPEKATLLDPRCLKC